MWAGIHDNVIHIIRAVSSLSEDYILDNWTINDLERYERYFQNYPPLHILVKGAVGYKHKSKKEMFNELKKAAKNGTIE